MRQTSKWELSIIDNPSNQIGNWVGTNLADINISTTKGHNFVIEGNPGGFNGRHDSHDYLMLTYDTQK